MVSRDQIDLEDLTTSSLPCHRVPYPAAKFSGTGLRSCQTSAVEGDGGYPSLPRERTTPGHRLLCRLGSESEPGGIDGTTYLEEKTLEPVYSRHGWSDNDLVLQKPVGWSNGFCKEERHLFCPNAESFGHPGMGGALGWADPVEEVAIGYAMNRMDWRIRSPRIIALCRKLYDCEAMVE